MRRKEHVMTTEELIASGSPDLIRIALRNSVRDINNALTVIEDTIETIVDKQQSLESEDNIRGYADRILRLVGDPSPSCGNVDALTDEICKSIAMMGYQLKPEAIG